MSGYTFEKRRLDEIIAAAEALEEEYSDPTKQKTMQNIRKQAEFYRENTD